MLNPLNFLSKIIKSSNQKELDRFNKIVKKINDLEEEARKLEDSSFPKKTEKFIEQVANGASLDQLLPEAFALVREASKRINNERHFDVQIIGGIVLHENKIAEMKTGEGKTLTITLAAYLNALTKKGVHIITVNDYLAKRDSEWMGELGTLYNDSPHLRDNGGWQYAYMYYLGLIIGGGTSQIQKNIISERGLGLPKEPKIQEA